MRVAMVVACEFPALRGSQVLVQDLAMNLADLGHEVHLLTHSGGGRLDASRPSLPGQGEAAPPGRWAGRFRKNLKLAVDLYQLVRRERIEVIHAHNYEAPLLAYPTRWLTGVPVVYHSHNALSDELAAYVGGRYAKSIARRLGGLLDRQVPRRADYAIALTDELEAFLLRCGVDPMRLGVLPPGVVSPNDTLDSHEIRDGGEFVVGYAGNLDAYQDLDVLFQGFQGFRRQVQNAILRIITHEVDWRRRAGWMLEDLVAQGSAHVVVAPAFSDVSGQMRRAHVLVCPRSSWSGYPIKLLNYMAAGRPIVAAAGSAKGICDEVSCLTFRNGDSRHLAEQLLRLHADTPLGRRLVAGATATLRKNHDGKKIASEIAKIHARLGNRRSNKGIKSRRSGPQASGVRRLVALIGRRVSAVSSVTTTRYMR